MKTTVRPAATRIRILAFIVVRGYGFGLTCSDELIVLVNPHQVANRCPGAGRLNESDPSDPERVKTGAVHFFNHRPVIKGDSADDDVDPNQQLRKKRAEQNSRFSQTASIIIVLDHQLVSCRTG